MVTYQVHIEVVTPDYRYWNVMHDSMGPRHFGGRESALSAIEDEIVSWPNWTEGRKASFRSHCKLVKVGES